MEREGKRDLGNSAILHIFFVVGKRKEIDDFAKQNEIDVVEGKGEKDQICIESVDAVALVLVILGSVTRPR